MIKHICFILDDYPCGSKSPMSFAQTMIRAIALSGIKCTVIAPQIRKNIDKELNYQSTDVLQEGCTIDVYKPEYLYLKTYPFSIKISMDNHLNAVRKTIIKERLNPDCFYGHFIFQCGITAIRMAQELDVKSFVAVGESDKLVLDSKRGKTYFNGLKYAKWERILQQASGVIAVSEWVKTLLLKYEFYSSDANMIVLPNGINADVFHPGNYEALRKKYGILSDEFIVIYVGAFNENKGGNRLVQALDVLGDPQIRSVFVGREGSYIPQYKNALFCGSCNNSKVAEYLQLADLFVLPTRSEGCCNAILEALATGIPVVSSDKPFNDGILDDSNSIRVDVDNITEIANAIEYLKNNKQKLTSLKDGAIQKSTLFDIRTRAAKMVEFMNGKYV